MVVKRIVQYETGVPQVGEWNLGIQIQTVQVIWMTVILQQETYF